MWNFTIERPETVAEALDILARDPDGAVLYAGGTELILAMKEGLVSATTLVDVKTLPELAGIRLTDDGSAVEIGARVTHREILSSTLIREHLPLLPEVTLDVGNVRVRAAGTLVGNLCFAEPHSDIAVVGTLLDASVRILGENARWTRVEEFLLGAYVTALAPDELVEKIRIEIPQRSSFFGYGRVKATERPLVAVGVRLDVEGGRTVGARVVIGSVGPRPWSSPDVEAMLIGVAPSELRAVLPAVAQVVATGVDAETDYDASEEYRRHLAGEAFVRAALQAISRTEGASR
jgi:carbon-monoxide dehydrogenase medium subunit